MARRNKGPDIFLAVSLILILAASGGWYFWVKQNRNSSTINMAYKLARIDEGKGLSRTDPAVEKYDKLLDELSEKCLNPRFDIGEIAIRIQKTVKERYKKNVSLLQLLKEGDRLMPGSGKQQDFGQVMYEVMQKFK